MMDWKSGPGMIDEEEEEGEFHCKDDINDTSSEFDLDVALSYIGDKVQSLLGHFQKDFEGGVLCTENLGPRLGGYGSFLPVHQRSPLSKSPTRVQTPKLLGSLSQISKEQCGPAVAFPIHMGPPAPTPRLSIGLSQSSKASAGDALVKLKSSANFDQVETLCEKVGLPVKKSTNPLKFRIKLPQSLRKQHDLGLTSSTSGDVSSEECSGLQVESHDDSPTNIIQMMTSFPGDGSMLLSPLCDELVNLLEEVEYSVYSGNEAALESSSISTRLLKTDVFQGKEMENACKGESLAISENELEAQCLKSCYDLDEKYVTERVMEPKKVVQVKKSGERESTDRVKLRAESSYSVKATSLENVSDKSSTMYEQSSFKARNQSKLSDSDTFACPGSFKAGPEISEGRRVKRALSKSSAEVGLQYNSGEEGESTLLRAVNSLSSDEKLKGCQSSGKQAPKVKVIFSGSNASKNKHSGNKVHPVKNDLANTSSDYKDNMKVRGNPSGVLQKKSCLETAKTKSMHAGALKDAGTEKYYSGSLTSLADTTQPPTPAVLSNEGVATIEEWVGCDNCDKWRLLPYGRKAALLGENWTCSMLDWLPGMNMNHCDVSQDETTLAVHPTYPPNTACTYSSLTHAANNANLGVISGSSDQSHQNLDSDHNAAEHMRKQTLKQKLIRDRKRIAAPSSGKANLNQHSLQMRRTKASNQSVPGQIANKYSDLKHTTNSATLVSKSTKRKDEHMISDDTVPAKRTRKESFQDANKMMTTKIKTSGEPSSDNFQKSRLFNKAAIKDIKKQSTEQPAEKGKAQISSKQQLYKMQDLPDNGALVHKSSKGREVVNSKRKSTSQEYSQPLHTQQKHVKVSIQEKNDGEFHRDKKSRLSHVEGKENESQRCKVDDAVVNLKRDRDMDQQTRKVGPKGTVTLEDIDKLRKELWCEEPSTAAISSSSKISESRKNKIKFMDVKRSPGESVSSSPARFHKLPMLLESESKMNSMLNHASVRGTVKKSGDFNECSKTEIAMKEKTTVLDFRETDGREKSSELACSASYGQYKNDSNRDTSNNTSSYMNSTKNLTGRSAVQISRHMDDKWGDLCSKKPLPGSIVALGRSFVESRPSETSVAEDSLKSRKDQNVIGNWISQYEAFMAANKNFSNLIVSSSLKKAIDVLREAEEHRRRSDQIKKASSCSESNSQCFKAAIKCLYGASLLEACCGENCMNIELNPMEIYATVAELFKTCACDYEKDHKLAAASLAYKCVEVACMRVVHIKSPATQKVRLDLQSSLHRVSQGESPSSSASDIDNLNNSAMAEKTTLIKGYGSHPANHDIPPRNCSSVQQLLDFTNNAIAAMEASKKSQEMFMAASVKLENSDNKDGMDSVKKVIDFSFEDVDAFVQLVTLAFNTINCQTPS